MSLRDSATVGVKWMGVASAITIVTQLLQYTILARLLNPEDFGLMNMMIVVFGLAQAFGDMGISNAIIHRQDATLDQLSSLYWLNIFAGISVFVLVIALSPLVVLFYREPRIQRMIMVGAAMFLIAPFGQQFQMLLQKEMKFDIIAKTEVISAVAGTVVAVLTALMGQGVFAMIWGQLTNTAFRSLLYAKVGWSSWRPRLHFRRIDLKGYMRFGIYQMGERCVNYFSANVDYIMIGRFLGPQVLGAYSLAYQVVVMPITKINPIITRVAYPVFAKKQTDNQALCRGYLQMMKLLGIIVFPLLIGVAVISPVVVPVLFGNKWGQTAVLIQIMALVGILKSLGNPSGTILLAKGRADIGFKWNVTVAAINTAVFWMCAKYYGVYAVAWSWVALSILYAILMQLILNYIVKLQFVDYVASFSKSLILSIGMGLVVYVGYLFLPAIITNEMLLLAVLIALGFGSYALANIFFDHENLSHTIALIFKKSEVS